VLEPQGLIRLILDDSLELKCKYKARPLSLLRLKRYLALKFFNDKLRDHESKADPIHVHVFVILNEAKQLKKLVLVLDRDANSRVSHRNLQVSLGLLISDNLHTGLHLATLGEFQGVGLEAEEHLHNPMLVTIDKRTLNFVVIIYLIIIAGHVDKFNSEINLFIQGLLSLNAHYFFDGVPDVENLVVVPEFIAFDLCKVKHVLNYKIHDLS
jgi:hypothetical protein